jgi:Abortive infection alpha
MDEESKELVAVVTEAGVRGFLETIAAPLTEAGGWGADIIRRHRFRTQVKTLVLAKRMLDDAGLSAHAVAPRLLVPLLENASLESDPDEADDSGAAAAAMQTRWAALLANAAAGDRGAPVRTAFPTILAELEPIEARMLEELAKQPPDVQDLWGLRVLVGLDAADESVRVGFLAHIDNLTRNRLCEVRWPDAYLQNLAEYLEREESGNPSSISGVRARPITFKVGMPRPETRELVHATELGRAFVRACTPPAGNA